MQLLHEHLLDETEHDSNSSKLVVQCWSTIPLDISWDNFQCFYYNIAKSSFFYVFSLVALKNFMILHGYGKQLTLILWSHRFHSGVLGL